MFSQNVQSALFVSERMAHISEGFSFSLDQL